MVIEWAMEKIVTLPTSDWLLHHLICHFAFVPSGIVTFLTSWALVSCSSVTLAPSKFVLSKIV